MQTQDHKKISSSGQGHGNHVCNKCGWSFPNPHPSSKQRRAHKKNCGKIEGYKLGTTSEETQPNLNEHLSDDDSKSPSLTKKVEDMAFTRSSSSGVDDVFSDAVTEFAGVPPPATGSPAVRETAVVMQGSSEDAGIAQQDLGKAVEDAGDLYPPHNGNGTQLHNIECSRPESERLENDTPSQHHLSSSTMDSNSSSDSSVIEASVSESTLQCSKADPVLDSEERGNLEADVSCENAGKSSEAVLLPQKVNGDDVEFGDNGDCSSKIAFAGETNSSEDTMKIPADFPGKTAEAVSVPEIVNTDNAAVEANDKQFEGFFDARNISFAKGEYFGQINSIEEASKVEADRPLEMLEGHDSINASNALPLKEHSEDVLEDYEDHKSEALPVATSLDLAQEVECVELRKDDGLLEKEHSKDVPEDNDDRKTEKLHVATSLDLAQELECFKRGKDDALSKKKHSGDVLEDYEDHKTEKLAIPASLDLAQEAECVELSKDDANQDAFSSLSLDEPSKSPNKISEDITSEALGTDAEICGSVSAVVHPDKNNHEIGQGEMVASPEQLNSVIFSNTNVQSVLDESGDLTHSVNGVKTVHDDSEHDNKDNQIFGALEADSTQDEEGKLPVAIDRAVDHDFKTREVEENLSEDTPIVPQSDHGRDDKVEAQKYDEHESKTAMSESIEASMEKFQDPEGVKDPSNSSKQMLISGIHNNANMTDERHVEDNYVASDSVDVSFFNNAMSTDSQQVANECLAKEPQNFDEKVPSEECLGKVDLGLISDNDENVDTTQNTSNKIEADVQVEAASAVEDSFTKKKEGSGSDFAGDNGHLVKLEEPVPDLDIQNDAISQADSLEGNWGSVSVLSALSDAPAGTETGSLPSQSSVKAEKDGSLPKPNDGKSGTLNLPDVTKSPEQKVDASGQNVVAPEAQTSEKPNESSGSKKTEEIIAKVANWSTASVKEQHTSLKNFLGDSSSPNVKDNPPLKTQETEKMVTSDNTKEPEDGAAMGEMQREWNSPARYPTNIKREKGKARSKPYWAPFMCCSSVQTS